MLELRQQAQRCALIAAHEEEPPVRAPRIGLALWIKRVTDVYPKCVWLNPEPEAIWSYRQSIDIIKELMNARMFPTPLAGLARAMKVLAK